MLRRSIARVATALLLAVVALLQVQAPALAREVSKPTPALWKVDGAAGDVYFFGSIHILPKGMEWRRPELDAALAEAQQLVFELNMEDAENPHIMGMLAVKYGFLPPDQSLHRMLAPEHRKRLDDVAVSFGLRPDVIDHMRPWFAAITLNSLAIIKQTQKPGQSPDANASLKDIAGVDSQLWTWAAAAGKERSVLETAEDQIRVFADLPHDRQVELLIVSLDEVTRPPETLGDMVEAWRTGDTAKLDKAFNADMDTFPVLRNAVLDNRHEKWLPKIERMMADGRTHVVVVGTAHLVGKNSIIAMLRARGVKVEGP